MNQDGDLISVVMPCFNSASFVDESVACVLGQTHRNVQLVIVDDGSTDDSRAIIERWCERDSRVDAVFQANSGAAAARNAALARVKGDYIAFLDSDDTWEPNGLELMLRTLREHDAQMVYCGWQNTGVPANRSAPFVPPDYADVDRAELLLQSNRWPIHAALSVSHVILDSGRFDESLSSCMDYDLWLRTAPTVRLVRVPHVLATYRHHEGAQITKNALRIAINTWRTQKKFLDANPDVVHRLGRRRIRQLTYGELLRRAYDCYWRRDLPPARALFRMVMKGGYGSLNDWKYMLPAWLPQKMHERFLASRDA